MATEGCMHFLYWALCLSWAFSVKTGKIRDRYQHLCFWIVHKRDSNSDLYGSVRGKILFIWSFSLLMSAKLTAAMPVKYPWHWADIERSCFPHARPPLQHCKLALLCIRGRQRCVSGDCGTWYWWGEKWRCPSWEQLERSVLVRVVGGVGAVSRAAPAWCAPLKLFLHTPASLLTGWVLWFMVIIL